MATAGYSGTSLIKKLGIKPEMKILLINKPNNYYKLLEVDITDQSCKKNEIPDLIHLFVKSAKEFESEMKALKSIYKKNSSVIIWISWYKKSSKIVTDVTEDKIRAIALANGLVDIKVCAINETWSGLKLVMPVKNR